MRKKLTVDEEVYDGLHRIVGRRHISRFINALAKPHVVPDALEAGYRAMAADEARERERGDGVGRRPDQRCRRRPEMTRAAAKSGGSPLIPPRVGRFARAVNCGQQ
jgi:hypothetical protein